MIYVLDTDTFTLAYHNRAGVRDRIADVTPPDAVVIGAATRVEAIKGRLDYILRAKDGADALRAFGWLAQTEAYLAGFRVLPFDQAVADHFARLRADKRCRGAGVGDLLVASIALTHGATLVTRNTKDFAPVPGLMLADWAA
ncbi:MAG: type II toxin-antitoxin system VapC family toxin [Fimbriiglobus sp.]